MSGFGPFAFAEFRDFLSDMGAALRQECCVFPTEVLFSTNIKRMECIRDIDVHTKELKDSWTIHIDLGQLAPYGHVIDISDDAFVSNESCVSMMYTLAHEFRHAYQDQVLFYDRNLNDDLKSLALSRVPCSNFYGYYCAYHDVLPFELDAMKFGISYIQAYVENYSGLYVDNVQNLNINRGLMATFTDLYHVPLEFARSADKLLLLCERTQNNFSDLSRTMFVDPSSDTDLITKAMFKKYCPAWLDDLPFSGKGSDFDEKVFALVRDVNPTLIDSYPCFSALKEEIAEKYPSRRVEPLSVGDRVRHLFGVRSAAEETLFAIADSVENNSSEDISFDLSV